jgi:hypothetical protein
MRIVLGLILIGIAVALFFVERNQRGKIFSLRSAKPATAAELMQLAQAVSEDIGGGSWRDYVKLMGTVECDRPLRSELTQVPCVYYSMSVKREYEETVTRTDDKGNTRTETQRGSEVISSNTRSTPFWLNDGTGRIEVILEGAAVEAEKVLDEFQPDTAPGGGLSFGGFSISPGLPLTGRRTVGYRYTESLLPMDRRILVVGMVSDHTGTLVLQKPTQGQQRFIVSLKTDESLIAQSDRHAKSASRWMIGCLTAGVLLILWGILF